MGPGMSMGMGMQQRAEMKLYLAPRMIQSMEILQLPIMALQERIQQELQENPVLELKETSDDQTAEEAEAEAAAAPAEETKDPGAGELVIDERGDNEIDFDRLEALNRDWEDHFNEEHRPSRNSMDEEGDKKHDAMQNMASRPQSLQDYLADQLTFFDTSPEQVGILRYLITHIDENGYLSVPLEDIARSHEPPLDLEELEDALAFVQKLDPPGVGARDLRECLLLQLTPDTPHRDTLRVLIQNHIEDLQHNRLPAIQRKTGFDLHE